MTKFYDIEKMTNDEFISYRENLLKDYLSKGYKLTPNIDCSMCDIEYTCFQCEIYQIEEKKS